MKVAIYSRVSTDDRGQDPLNQLLQLREFASRQGWSVVREYTDRATGKNGERTQFREMMREATRHRFDVLLFWSLDRLTREGTFKTLCYLRQLSATGVMFKSYTEQYIDSLGPFAEAVIGIIGAVAQQERVRISERTKAGMARVRASGKHVGRPRAEFDLDSARRMRKAGVTYSGIANKLGVSPAVAWKRLNLNQESGRARHCNDLTDFRECPSF